MYHAAGTEPAGKGAMHVMEAALRAELVALGLSHEFARHAAAFAFEAGIAKQVHPPLNVVDEIGNDQVQQARAHCLDLLEEIDTFWVVRFQTDRPDRRPMGRFINAQGARSIADAFEPLGELVAATISMSRRRAGR
jgi:hypothetical protein